MLLLLVAMLLAAPLQPLRSLAESLDEQPMEGVLVLENGNLLHGKVQRQGKHYHVFMPNGELRVREQQVDMFCRNIEEAYQRRRDSRAGSSADSHIDLAGWCLKHKLYGHAQTELESAAAINSSNRRLAQMQRQLKHVLQMDALKRKQQIAEATPIAEPKPIDSASLEKAPRWARALFVRQIQPLVIHSCGTGGCHQVGSESNFQLNRLAIDGAGHPDATLRNLATTLEQIDWQSADQSKLIQRAQLAHGPDGSSTPLPPHKLQVLRGWVEQLAEAHHKERELRTLPMIAEAEPVTEPTLQLIPPVRTASPTPGEIRTASYEPADPFDPAVFNERYATARKPTIQTQTKPLSSQQTSTAQTVPHVLVPSEPQLTPLPATE